jgi:uncharacterized membrane protein HdeD (DUF308 family)
MSDPNQIEPFEPSFMSVKQIRGRMTFEGITLLVLGVIAILTPIASTYIATIIVGGLLIAGGILRFIHGFEHRYRPGIGWLVLSSILYIGAGAAVLWAPLLGAVSLTLVVGAALVLSAVSKAIRAYQVRDAGATGWLLFDAIMSALLGILLLAGLPGTAVWVLGTIVGLDLIIGGITLIGMMSRAKGASSV